MQTSDSTVLISLVGIPMIENGCGKLAINGDWTIGFWPDGWGDSPTDGDASLRVENPGEPGVDLAYAVQWVANAAPAVPVSATSIWNLALLVLLIGIVGNVYFRRRTRA